MADHVARVPLFDRLVDLDRWAPREPRPYRTLTYAQLLESVQKEVGRVLNTRAALTLEELGTVERSVINYGASDLAWANPMEAEDQIRITEMLAHTVTSFEPRLRQVQVHFDRYEPTDGTLYIILMANLAVEHITQPVAFPIAVKASAREAGT